MQRVSVRSRGPRIVEAVTFVGAPIHTLGRCDLLATACCCCTMSSRRPNIVRAAPSADPARPIHAQLDAAAAAIKPRIIARHRVIHANPKLGHWKHRTARRAHLRALGYKVRGMPAVTGIAAVLRDGAGPGPGPFFALRADMDALPFAGEVPSATVSNQRIQWDGVDIRVLQACGHDCCHMASLLAAAEVLAANRDAVRGTVMLAEDEIGGAKRNLAEGAFADPKPDIVFGLHVVGGPRAGTIGTDRALGRRAPTSSTSPSAAGKPTAHGPGAGVDLIIIGAQILTALQTIQSHQVSVKDPSVLSVDTFQAGLRQTIISDYAVMTGTLRTYAKERLPYVRSRLTERPKGIAYSVRGGAETTQQANRNPCVFNDPALVERMVPSVACVFGPGRLVLSAPPPRWWTRTSRISHRPHPACVFSSASPPPTTIRARPRQPFTSLQGRRSQHGRTCGRSYFGRRRLRQRRCVTGPPQIGLRPRSEQPGALSGSRAAPGGLRRPGSDRH